MDIVLRDTDTFVTDPVFQWDLNQVINIRGVNMTEAPVIHFQNRKSVESIKVQSEMANNVITCNIPNVLLRDPYSILMFLVSYAENKETTKYRIEIPVRPRSKPEDYDYVDNIPIMTYESIMADIGHRFESMGLTSQTRYNELVAKDTDLANRITGLNTIKADKSELSVQKERIDQFARLTSASTTGDAELMDIRVGYDGITDVNAGAAVRRQANKLNELIEGNFVQATNHIEEVEGRLTARINKNSSDIEDLSKSVKNSIPVQIMAAIRKNLSSEEDGEYQIQASCMGSDGTLYVVGCKINEREDGYCRLFTFQDFAKTSAPIERMSVVDLYLGHANSITVAGNYLYVLSTGNHTEGNCVISKIAISTCEIESIYIMDDKISPTETLYTIAYNEEGQDFYLDNGSKLYKSYLFGQLEVVKSSGVKSTLTDMLGEESTNLIGSDATIIDGIWYKCYAHKKFNGLDDKYTEGIIIGYSVKDGHYVNIQRFMCMGGEKFESVCFYKGSLYLAYDGHFFTVYRADEESNGLNEYRSVDYYSDLDSYWAIGNYYSANAQMTNSLIHLPESKESTGFSLEVKVASQYGREQIITFMGNDTSVRNCQHRFGSLEGWGEWTDNEGGGSTPGGGGQVDPAIVEEVNKLISQIGNLKFSVRDGHLVVEEGV